jgi:hypothetical protein
LNNSRHGGVMSLEPKWVRFALKSPPTIK